MIDFVARKAILPVDAYGLRQPAEYAGSRVAPEECAKDGEEIQDENTRTRTTDEDEVHQSVSDTALAGLK